MKLNIEVPRQRVLKKYYDLFQSGKASWKDFFYCYQWVRFDPRLGEILIDFMQKKWRSLNPMEAHGFLERAEWPQVFGVLGEHVKLNIDKKERPFFKAWLDCATLSVPPADAQLFYLGLFPFAGKSSQNEALRSLQLYRRWGFLSAHPMKNKVRSTRSSATLLKKSLRMQMLKELLDSKKSITVNDYIDYVNGAVSRRTAEMDLKSLCIKRGETKGSSYVKARNPKLK